MQNWRQKEQHWRKELNIELKKKQKAGLVHIFLRVEKQNKFSQIPVLEQSGRYWAERGQAPWILHRQGNGLVSDQSIYRLALTGSEFALTGTDPICGTAQRAQKKLSASIYRTFCQLWQDFLENLYLWRTFPPWLFLKHHWILHVSQM